MTTGYYSLIQFVPDRGRMEAANVGVVLFCPDTGYFGSRMSTNVRRARKFFGNSAVDPARFAVARRSAERRARAAAQSFRTSDDLRAFIAGEANEVRFTDPRPVRVDVPAEALERLFSRLVETKPAGRHRSKVEDVLSRAFGRPEFTAIIKRDLPVIIPEMSSAVTMPFGYQNGRFNFVKPATFSAGGADVVQKTGFIRLEGELLYEHESKTYGKMQLVVVADFPDDTSGVESSVRRLLEPKNTRVVRVEQVSDFLAEILREGKPVREPHKPEPHVAT